MVDPLIEIRQSAVIKFLIYSPKALAHRGVVHP